MLSRLVKLLDIVVIMDKWNYSISLLFSQKSESLFNVCHHEFWTDFYNLILWNKLSLEKLVKKVTGRISRTYVAIVSGQGVAKQAKGNVSN